MAFLELANLKKSFGQTQVVHDFNMKIEKGEFISFLGPSGCGKTTVLRMIAGFETPSAGSIQIGGKEQGNLKPNKRNIGMVFQAYALFPNMSVHDNVAFGLKIAGAQPAEIDSRVKEMLSLIKLDHLSDRYPYQLSGGQQQRVALARAPSSRRCCCSTSRSRRLTPRSACRCARKSAPSSRSSASPPSLLPMTRKRRCRSPIVSSS
jgi:putative spermidine/putrescine transport system ATP-binding protein